MEPDERARPIFSIIEAFEQAEKQKNWQACLVLNDELRDQAAAFRASLQSDGPESQALVSLNQMLRELDEQIQNQRTRIQQRLEAGRINTDLKPYTYTYQITPVYKDTVAKALAPVSEETAAAFRENRVSFDGLLPLAAPLVNRSEADTQAEQIENIRKAALRVTEKEKARQAARARQAKAETLRRDPAIEFLCCACQTGTGVTRMDGQDGKRIVPGSFIELGPDLTNPVLFDKQATRMAFCDASGNWWCGACAMLVLAQFSALTTPTVLAKHLGVYVLADVGDQQEEQEKQRLEGLPRNWKQSKRTLEG